MALPVVTQNLYALTLGEAVYRPPPHAHRRGRDAEPFGAALRPRPNNRAGKARERPADADLRKGTAGSGGTCSGVTRWIDTCLLHCSDVG
jgi:hypothetical protein